MKENMMSEQNEAAKQSVVHTPGPWRLDPWNGWLVSAEDVGIVKFDMNRTLLADAKLMAAAPVMLSALRRIVQHQDVIGGSMASISSTRHIAAQAIQYATGEQV